MSKVNWIKAREDYILDPTISLENIAEKYGVSLTTAKVRSAKEGWVKLRQKTSETLAETLPEKAGEEQANYLARKFKEGKEIADLGRKVLLVRKTSIGTLVAKEMFVAGHQMQTEALGLNNPKNQINIQNNVAISFSDIVKKVRERAQKEADGQAAQ